MTGAVDHQFAARMMVVHMPFQNAADGVLVENISDRVGVMYRGQIVEMGSRAQVFGNPQHPYTRRLMDAVPVPDPTHLRSATARPTDEIMSPVYSKGTVLIRNKLIEVTSDHLVAVER